MGAEEVDDLLPAKEAAPKLAPPLAETLALMLSLTCCIVSPATISVSLSLMGVEVMSPSFFIFAKSNTAPCTDALSANAPKML